MHIIARVFQKTPASICNGAGHSTAIQTIWTIWQREHTYPNNQNCDLWSNRH
jgi:hypothetical protein